MIGVWVNAIAIVAGGLIGCMMKGSIPERYRVSVQQGLALCVMLIGISGAIKTQNVMLVIVSVVLGTVAGELLKIENGLDRLGNWAQNRFAKNDGGFAQGFVSASLLFCVGSMAVVGSIEAGIRNAPDTLLAKSALDGVAALIFASTMGPGVIASAIPVTLYQGGIALAAAGLGHFLNDEAIREMSATGSVLIIGLSLNMIGATKQPVHVGSMLPAIILPAAWISIQALF